MLVASAIVPTRRIIVANANLNCCTPESGITPPKSRTLCAKEPITSAVIARYEVTLRDDPDVSQAIAEISAICPEINRSLQ
jgi:hypothetical protein